MVCSMNGGSDEGCGDFLGLTGGIAKIRHIARLGLRQSLQIHICAQAFSSGHIGGEICGV